MNKGFLVISLTIILSVLVLIVLIFLVYPSFALYSIILDEDKNLNSKFLAESCLEIVLLRILQNQDYQGNETLNLENTSCFVFPVENLSQGKLIRIKSNYNNFSSYLKVIFDVDNRNIKLFEWKSSF